MESTYAVITSQAAVHSGAVMHWCFAEMQPKQGGLSPLTSCDHLKGIKKKKTLGGKCPLTPDCEARKHPDKGLFFGGEIYEICWRRLTR